MQAAARKHVQVLKVELQARCGQLYLSMGGNNLKLYVFTDQMYQQLLTGTSHSAAIYNKLLTCYMLFELTEKLALEASLCVVYPLPY